ncbi:hypothetical protein HY086_04350 [Candidatus Gottesmanbacteria bacterium]|nr:hypothetical protein [Candidatus Gottesmanbacteria bacterium]
MDVQRKHYRLGIRYANVFVFLAGFAGLALLLVLLLWQLFPASPFRTTVLLAGNPVRVASWDGTRKHVTVIAFPASVAITGLTGVGEYSLESLWKLGELDKRDKGLLADSVGEALAVPIPWYIGPTGASSVREIFSLRNIFGIVTGKFRTNLSLQIFLPLALATQSLRTDAFEELNVADTPAVVQKELADGTSEQFIDGDRLDVVLGTRLEEEDVRTQSLRVMIYNTTATQTLGRRMERRVSRAGALVVGIGNDSPAVGRCIVSGPKEKLETKTTIFFTQFFGCETKVGESIRSDLELRVGSDFEKLFVPR